jgi:hypothetical protein
MAKKTVALVRTHINRMHIIDSALQTFTTMSHPQEKAAALQRTGTAKFFTGTHPVKPRNSLSPPLKPALNSTHTAPGVQFQKRERPVANVAREVNDSPKAPNPVTSGASAQSASKTKYPPKTGMDTVKYVKCDQMGHFARDCRNPSTKPLSDHPNSYQRTKSPGPTRKPSVPNAHVAVQGNQGTDAFEWDNEEAGLGCVTVHTAPVSVGFNTKNLTDTATGLPIAAQTPAPSLLDDGDVESHSGPPPPKVNATLQFHNDRERERYFQESRYQFSQPTYTEEEDIYSEEASEMQIQSSLLSVLIHLHYHMR